MPNRYIREGINSSERVCSLDWGAECFYRRLLLVVDDFGRFEFSREIKSRCFPIHESVRMADVSRWFAACEKAGLIVCYDQERELKSSELVPGQKAWLVVLATEEPRARYAKYPNPPQPVGEKHGLWKPCECDKPPRDCSCLRLYARVNICTHVRPFPSTFPVHVPVPEHVPEHVPVSEGARVANSSKGFPESADDALRQCSLDAIPRDFVTETFDKALSRGGKDAKGLEIANFPAYCRTELKYAKDRKGRDDAGGPGKASGTSTADKIQNGKEFERAEARMKVIKGQYEAMQSWSDDDKAEYKKLRDRKTELKELLGITI